MKAPQTMNELREHLENFVNDAMSKDESLSAMYVIPYTLELEEDDFLTLEKVFTDYWSSLPGMFNPKFREPFHMSGALVQVKIKDKQDV